MGPWGHVGMPGLFQAERPGYLLISPTEIEPQGYRYNSGRTAIYFVGEFSKENCEFKAEHSDEMDYGLDFYAPQMLRDGNGWHVMIAWMQMWERNNPSAKDGWAGAMTIPRELLLRDDELYQNLICEVETYRREKVEHRGVRLEAGQSIRLAGISGSCCDIEINVIRGSQTIIEWRVMANQAGTRYASITVDMANGLVTFDRSLSESGISGLNNVQCLSILPTDFQTFTC